MISVIIPVYNVRNYIVKCLSSVAAQTYSGAMECLIIDDCGQDDSIQLAEEFIQTYRGSIDFRIIRHENNKGLSGARNTGLKEAKGEYIGFIDSDDWVEPRMYEELVNMLASDPNALFVTSSIIGETPKGIVWGFAFSDMYEDKERLTPLQFLNQMIAGETNNAVWNKLYRKEFIKIFFQEGKICEDYLFFFDNCIIQECGHILMTSKTFYHYIVREGSITNQSKFSEKQSWIDWMENMVYVADSCKENFPKMFNLQVTRFNERFNCYFESIINNPILISKRKKELANINRYARTFSPPDVSFVKKIDFFIATYTPCGYGYMIVRKFRDIRHTLIAFL